MPDRVPPYAPVVASGFSPQAVAQVQRDGLGLSVSENPTVDGLKRLVGLDGRNQSRLKRRLPESPFAVGACPQARLALLPSLPSTAMHPTGGLALDATLLTHAGQPWEKIASLDAAAPPCAVWAHPLVQLHYRNEQPDSPIALCLGEPADWETLATGLTAAGMPIRPSTLVRRDHEAKPWRQSLLGLWRRPPQQAAVGKRYQRQGRFAQEIRRAFVNTHPQDR
jgi:hypothetical protein